MRPCDYCGRNRPVTRMVLRGPVMTFHYWVCALCREYLRGPAPMATADRAVWHRNFRRRVLRPRMRAVHAAMMRERVEAAQKLAAVRAVVGLRSGR